MGSAACRPPARDGDGVEVVAAHAPPYASIRGEVAAAAARQRRWDARATQVRQLRVGLGEVMDPVIRRSIAPDPGNLASLVPGLLELRTYLCRALQHVARPNLNYPSGDPALRVERLVNTWVGADGELARAGVATATRDESDWRTREARSVNRLIKMERLTSRLLRQLGASSNSHLERTA